MKLKIGDKVVHAEDPYKIGIIISGPDDGLVAVSFENSKILETEKVSDLVIFDEKKKMQKAKKLQAAINKTASELEKAFKYLEKVKQLRDSTFNFSEISDAVTIDYSELENVFERNGWSSSSLWC